MGWGGLLCRFFGPASDFLCQLIRIRYQQEVPKEVEIKYRLRYIGRMLNQIPRAADIRAQLEKLGHAQTQELARLSNVPFTTLWKIRSGETTNPRIDTVCQFMGHIEAAAEVKVPA